MPSYVNKACALCGVEKRMQKRQKYCSVKCRDDARRGVPNLKNRKGEDRTCATCGKSFYRPPSSPDRCCSLECSLKGGKAKRAGAASHARRVNTGRVKKDDNHDEIVAALEKLGCSIIDLAAHGYGLPDLLVSCRGILLLVEIKNTKTSYGRKGLNENQRAFATWWKGGSVYVIHNEDEAVQLVQGDREALAFKPDAEDIRALSVRRGAW